jgi:hypothetical protein
MTDAELCESIFEAVVEDEDRRRKVVMAFAESIRAAHEAAPSSWATSLFPKLVRLNAGQVEVFVVDARPRKMEISITASSEIVPGLSVRCGDSYPWINGTVLRLQETEFTDVYARVEQSHRDLVTCAARKKKKYKADWQARHSDGVLEYVELTLGTTLPRPGWTSVRENSPAGDTDCTAMADEALSADLDPVQPGSVTAPTTTEAERLAVQRVGQDVFRAGLTKYWHGRCAVTGLAVPELLRASHIKPWAACETDGERLDLCNGLLLAAHLDAAFDAGLMTIEDNGRVVVSERLNAVARALLGLERPVEVMRLTDGHRRYLAWHREKVFEL